MDFVRLALVNLYKASPKQARQSNFFLRFFYYLFNNTNPNCPRQLSEENRTNPENFAILAVKAAFLVAFDYTFEAYDPQRI